MSFADLIEREEDDGSPYVRTSGANCQGGADWGAWVNIVPNELGVALCLTHSGPGDGADRPIKNCAVAKTHFYMTPNEARALALALLESATASEECKRSP